MGRLGYKTKMKWSKEKQKSVRFYYKDTTKIYYDFDGQKL